MNKLVILSRKGGVGKSTLGVNLAVAAERAGHKVAIIDLDSQASASEWSDWREAETPEVISVHSARLPQALYRLEQDGFTFVVMDTPARIEEVATDAASAADFAMIPCLPAAFDITAMEKTVWIGNKAKVPMRIVINGVDARSSEQYRAKRAVEKYGVKVSPCLIGRRKVFSDAVLAGMSVMEYEPRSKASIEIQALYRYIVKEMSDATT